MSRSARRDVEDPSLSPLPHPRDDELCELERCTYLDLEHDPPLALLEVVHRDEPRDGCVVDEDVRRAEGVCRFADQLRAVLDAREIGTYRDRTPTVRFDRGDG